MAHIYYNSWMERYKFPFGAVKEGKRVDFWISVPSELETSVFFVVRKEGSSIGKISFPMNKAEEDRYHYQYKVDQGSGLYFYYFKIVHFCPDGSKRTLFYGFDGQGGEGKIEHQESEVGSYQMTCFEKAEIAPSWYREAVFYQIFPDRFANGNPNGEISSPKKNSFIYATEDDEPMYIRNKDQEVVRWDFFGGNLKGITQKISYFQELGITALYLNPIFEASSNHRYDTNDYFAIDPVLGTEKDFVEMLQALHQAGISVILDGVFSHVGRNSRYFNQAGLYGEKEGATRNPDSPYYPWFKFKQYPNDYEAWWGVADLPEVDKNNKSFQEFIYGDVESVLAKWTTIGVDGWRLDVADELTDEFIGGIRKNLLGYQDKILIGEVWEDASNKIAYDQRRRYVFGDHLQGVMNYPLRQQIMDVLNQTRSFEKVCQEMIRYQENYPEDFYYNQLNNIGTHDTERILTMLEGSIDKLSHAWGLLFMMPGIPCVYYGDEAGLTGGKDPENRKFFPWQNVNQRIYTSCKNWIQRRKKYGSMKYGEFFPVYSLENDIFGIIRYNAEEYTVYLVNVSDHSRKIQMEDLASPRQYRGEYTILQELSEGIELAPHQEYFAAKSLVE